MLPHRCSPQGISIPPTPKGGGILEISDEKAIRRDIATVCKCKAVRYKVIRRAIEAGAICLSEIRRLTGANTGCGCACTEKILEMIKEHSPAKGSEGR